MHQTYEFYLVDPATWGDAERIENVLSATLNRDLESDTLGNAVIDLEESIGESYFRVYLVTVQDGVRERHCLGTYMAETPVGDFDGRSGHVSIEAYTPLIELADEYPEIGFSVPSGSDVSITAARLIADNCRAPVLGDAGGDKLDETFVAHPDETWLQFISALLKRANKRMLLDERGQVVIAPIRDAAALGPSATFDDGNSSILMPEIEDSQDFYGVPNKYEAVVTKGGYTMSVVVENDSSSSEISVTNRGRVVRHRNTSPDVSGNPTEAELRAYAQRELKAMSCLERTLSYTHGYCGTNIGQAALLAYERAGINANALVVRQSIECIPGCPVTEVSKYSKSYY